MGKRGAGKIIIVSCSSDRGIHNGYHDSIAATLLAHGRTQIVDYYRLTSSPRIAEARNIVVEKAMSHPAKPDTILMIDTDMIFHRDDPLRLLKYLDADERPIVSGLYVGGRVDGPQKPHVYVWAEDGSGMNVVQGITGLNEWPDEGAYQVSAVGAGMLMVHRSALETIGDKYRDTSYPWFAETVSNGGQWGEDITFCVRAAACDIPIHLIPEVRCGHEKPGILDVNSYGRYLADDRTDAELEAEWFARQRVGGASQSLTTGAKKAPAASNGDRPDKMAVGL